MNISQNYKLLKQQNYDVAHKRIDKTKNRENASVFKVTEIVLVQCNVVDKALNCYIFFLLFISIKVEPVNLVILRASKPEFYKPDITLAD